MLKRIAAWILREDLEELLKNQIETAQKSRNVIDSVVTANKGLTAKIQKQDQIINSMKSRLARMNLFFQKFGITETMLQSMATARLEELITKKRKNGCTK